jgi:hypothetical protein
MMAADDELEGQLKAMLAIRHLPSLGRISIRVVDAVIFLGGTVMTYFERNVCEECCRQIPGVAGICNEIEVGGPGLGAGLRTTAAAGSRADASRRESSPREDREPLSAKEVPGSECKTPGAAVIP